MPDFYFLKSTMHLSFRYKKKHALKQINCKKDPTNSVCIAVPSSRWYLLFIKNILFFLISKQVNYHKEISGAHCGQLDKALHGKDGGEKVVSLVQEGSHEGGPDSQIKNTRFKLGPTNGSICQYYLCCCCSHPAVVVILDDVMVRSHEEDVDRNADGDEELGEGVKHEDGQQLREPHPDGRAVPDAQDADHLLQVADTHILELGTLVIAVIDEATKGALRKKT